MAAIVACRVRPPARTGRAASQTQPTDPDAAAARDDGRALRAGRSHRRRRRRCRTNERQALAKLVEAAKVFDALFLRQVWAGNETMLLDLARDQSPARPRAAALLPDQQGAVVAARPQRAVHPRRAGRSRRRRNFYPAGATKEEVEAWIKTLPDAERARATGFFTTIRRGPDGRFMRGAVQRSSTRASWRRSRRCCARPRR